MVHLAHHFVPQRGNCIQVFNPFVDLGRFLELQIGASPFALYREPGYRASPVAR